MAENKSESSSETIKAVPIEDNEVIPPEVNEQKTPIPLEKIIKLRRHGLSLQQIADILKCSKSNIHKRLEDFEGYKDFEQSTDMHYEVLQYRLLKTLDDAALQKMQPYQRIVAMAVLEDKKRLVRGQATQHIDINRVHGTIKEITAQEKILEARYRLLTGKELNTSKEIKTDTNK